MKLPWMKFWVSNWMNDTELSMCDAATRGIWIDLLCAMHSANRPSLSGTPEELARLGRCSAAELQLATDALSRSRAADVTISRGIITVVCRRLSRELKKREDDRKRKELERERKASHKEIQPVSRDRHGGEEEKRRRGEEKSERSARVEAPAQPPAASPPAARSLVGKNGTPKTPANQPAWTPSVVERMRAVLVGYAETHHLGLGPPDDAICGQALAAVAPCSGGDAELACDVALEWLRKKGRPGSRPQSWAWFPAALRQGLEKKL